MPHRPRKGIELYLYWFEPNSGSRSKAFTTDVVDAVDVVDVVDAVNAVFAVVAVDAVYAVYAVDAVDVVDAFDVVETWSFLSDILTDWIFINFIN